MAQALQRTHAGDLTSLGAQIAAHYDAASAGIEAVRWYEQASEAAQRLHASSDAVRFLERALELVRGLPDGVQRDALELRLLTALPAPLVAVEGYLSQRVGQVHERALELAAAVGLEPAAPLIRSLALATLARGDFAAARPFGEQLRLRAEREGDDVLWVESAYVLGVAAFWQGELNEARAQFQAALERCRPEHLGAHLVRYGQDPAVFCGLRLAYTLWFLGREDESARARDAALSLAEQIGHPFTWVSTKAWAALLALDQHDEERLRHHVDGLASTIETVSKPTRLFAEALLGYVDVLDGRTQEGMSVVRRALDDARDGEPAAPGLLAMHMRIIVEACARAEDAETGLAAADEALVMGRGTQLWESEIRRLRTHFLAATGAGPGTVEAELERALQVAKRQGARSIEVRIRESLDHFLPETL